MRVVVRVERSNIAPVTVFAGLDVGDDVQVEVVDKGARPGDEGGDDVAAGVVVGVLVGGIGGDGIDEYLGLEDVVAHRG